MNSMTIALVLLLLGAAAVGSSGTDSEKEDRNTLETVLPMPVEMFRWPEASTLSGTKVVDPNAKSVRFSKTASWAWIRLAIDASWAPPAHARMYFLAKEFDGRDTTRVAWVHENYRLEVCQTYTILALKIVPREGGDLGRTDQERLEVARKLSVEVFNRQGWMWPTNALDAGTSVSIANLNEKIARFSFDPARSVHLSGDGTLEGGSEPLYYGTPTTAGPSEAALPPEETSPARYYWFRNVRWWNDGKAVGFYYLKIRGMGGWIPSYDGAADKGGWFRTTDR